jgi:para-nitrobenzyl esterase
MGPTARVEQGTLAGVALPDGVRAYRGVPFARPPLGDLRWRPPLPPEPWEGVRPADTFAPHAPQPPVTDTISGSRYEPQSEDCLYLNVWTEAEEGERRPVMVWFHYGAFLFGGASIPLFDGAGLARPGAVVVTVNHRLGRLGFLAHSELSDESEHGVSGNYGLLDQIRALEWVQENIAAFGGDPACVTAFGLSAGSMSVGLLMASPLARGLFQRAIGESGAFFGPVETSSNMTDCVQSLAGAERTGLAVAKALGARSIAELRARTPEELVAVQLPGGAGEWSNGGVPFSRGELDGMLPIVDGHVIPASLLEIFGRGEQADVPLLTGSVANEASGMPWMTSAQAFVEDSRAEYGDRADEFLALFPAGTDDEAVASSAAANADRVFISQNWTWARQHAATASAPTFYYHFSHAPPAPPGAAPPGAYHGVEIPYVFRHLDVRNWPWTAYDRELSETISSYWLNFARHGDPNGPGVPEWARFDPGAPEAMRFGEEIGIGPIPRRAHLDFWDRYFAERRSRS